VVVGDGLLHEHQLIAAGGLLLLRQVAVEPGRGRVGLE
jgi:hypothetical protein